MVEIRRRSWGRMLWIVVAALWLVLTAAAGLEAAPAVPEQRVFPWLAVPVILIMGFCLYVMFKTEPPDEEIEEDDGHGPDEEHGVNKEAAQAGS